ncbi:putative NBD/HSP70 family sugar kinase [Agromyces cerinus]|nr:putative NBD/HSP70 family sugar kinase [Agromyces cerinus]
MSRPTVEVALARLVERGLVKEIEGGSDTATGRPARVFEFVERAGFVAGIDIARAGITVVIADISGRVLAQRRSGAPLPKDSLARLRLVTHETTAALAEAGGTVSRLVAAHVALTGWVGADGRLRASGAYPDWEGVDLTEHLSRMLGCEVRVDNDVNLAALAEHRIGAARLIPDMLYIRIGSGISAALVLDGKLRLGSHDSAGALAGASLPLPIDPQGDLGWADEPSLRAVLERADASEPEAAAKRDDFVDGLAELVGMIGQVVDPDCIVVGCDAAEHGDTIVSLLRQRLIDKGWLLYEPAIIASHLGDDAAVLGALTRAFDSSAKHLYGLDEVGLPEIRFSDVIATSKTPIAANTP